MQSVTSNAVARVIFPAYANIINVTSNPWTATQDCYCVYLITGTREYPLYIDNNIVSVTDSHNGIYVNNFSGYIRKGQVISGTNITRSDMFKAFSLN